jgi:hypothetical protein
MKLSVRRGGAANPAARAAFKAKVARINRWMAWINLPLMLVGSFMIHAWKDGVGPESYRSTGSALQGVFIILFFIHTLMSAYIYGIPKPARNVRVLHIYIGYALFFFIMSSQVFLKTEPLHTVLYFMQWVTLSFHVALSARFLFKRLAKRATDPQLNYYTGGKLVRNAQEI